MIAMLLILQLTDKGTKMIQIAFPAAVITASVILVQGRIRAHRAGRASSRSRDIPGKAT